MREVINDNGKILFVMSRFGIPLGFGDKTVEEVCAAQEVDTATFLAVANFVCHNTIDNSQIALASLIDYLRRAHTWFLEFNLPAIRRKIIEAIDCSGKDEVALLVLKFYDDYVSEVRAHMQHEEQTVFPYVDGLMKGALNRAYTIDQFTAKHNHIEDKLADLKNVIIRYYPQRNGGELLYSVLFDIINCEQDLDTHCSVEDEVFAPAVKQLEERLRRTGEGYYSEQDTTTSSTPAEQLSQREIEIIGCVAKGLTSKEIADKLCLSVHTVTTHRRNITSKLQIHTPAGLTIYAIANHIVSLDEIKLQ
ncbi:MAG: helix-turn-helix transcriptional regulator [Tidjanibacter sp.]|nr:helix-turn-helix transcriptional regulator [Tidjanibacter sp.]